MTHRVLIIDDEQEILSALATHLQLQGYEVETCNDPEQGLYRIEREKFHLAMLDINMPKMDGIQLLKAIKAHSNTIQVIMITAYSTLEKAIDCWDLGASDYILKPFSDLDEIARIVALTSERITRWEEVARRALLDRPKSV